MFCCFYAKCDVFGVQVQVVVSKLLFLFILKFREDSKGIFEDMSFNWGGL